MAQPNNDTGTLVLIGVAAASILAHTGVSILRSALDIHYNISDRFIQRVARREEEKELEDHFVEARKVPVLKNDLLMEEYACEPVFDIQSQKTFSMMRQYARNKAELMVRKFETKDEDFRASAEYDALKVLKFKTRKQNYHRFWRFMA